MAVIDRELAMGCGVQQCLAPLEVAGTGPFQRTGTAVPQIVARHLEDDLRTVAQRMASRGECDPVELFAADEMWFDVVASERHRRHKFLGVGERASDVFASMDHNHLGLRAALFRRRQMAAMSQQTQFLMIRRQVVGMGRIAAVAGVQIAAAR